MKRTRQIRRRVNPESVGKVSDVWRAVALVLAGYLVWSKFAPKPPGAPAS